MNPVLDTRALAQFLAVAETLSFRQAAERLHLSQPPLSRAIRTLEVRLGVPLFVRDTRAVALTEAGQRLLPQARLILRLLNEAERSVASVDSPAQLRVGATNAIEPGWFAGLAERIAARRPACTVSIVSDTSPRLVRQLRARRLHAAFIALPTETAGLQVSTLDRQPLMVAMASSHRLARRRMVALSDLTEEPVYWFERARQPAFFDHCRAVFARHGFDPRTVREPADHHVLLAGVAEGTAMALLPRTFNALRRPGVCYRTLREGEELAVSIGLATSPGADALHGLLVECANTAQQEPTIRPTANTANTANTARQAAAEQAGN
jgi:DNA-binding transcriptional LysR family regulator